jgi:hypothetical protein
MRSRLMIVLALCVLMLPLLNACAAGQEASGPALTGRAAAAISAAQTASAAHTSAQKAVAHSAKSTGGPATTTVAPYSPWQQLIDRAKALRSSREGGQDGFSLPSLWRSIYQNYRELQTSRAPGNQAIVPQ